MPLTTNEEEPQGIDSMIAKVDRFIANPKLATRRDFEELKEDLTDLKGFMDGDEEGNEEEGEEGEDNPGKPGLVIMIGKRMKKGGRE